MLALAFESSVDRVRDTLLKEVLVIELQCDFHERVDSLITHKSRPIVDESCDDHRFKVGEEDVKRGHAA